MKALLKIELIGYGRWKKFQNLPFPSLLGQMKKYWWVAKILGYDEKYNYSREFIKGQLDYSESNSKGTRGVYLYYFLDPGIYEVKKPTSWYASDRYFILSEHGKIKKISEENMKRELGTSSWLRKVT